MGDLYSQRGPGIVGLIIRIIINSILLLLISYLTPGFIVANLTTSFIAAVVIALMDYFIQAIFKIDATPFGRGLSGFIVAAIILYATQYFVSGYAISILGALIAAFLIGIVNLLIPGRVM